LFQLFATGGKFATGINVSSGVAAVVDTGSKFANFPAKFQKKSKYL
jgi:hypothetical protein